MSKTFKWTTIFLATLAMMFMATYSSHADARSFGGGRSSFSSRSFSKPSAPRYKAPAPKRYVAPKTKVTKVEKTTVIQNNTINQGSQGSGIMGTVVGSMAGSMAGNYLYDSLTAPDVPEMVAPIADTVEEKVEEVKELAPQIKPVCPENFICDFEAKKYYDLLNNKLIDLSEGK